MKTPGPYAKVLCEEVKALIKLGVEKLQERGDIPGLLLLGQEVQAACWYVEDEITATKESLPPLSIPQQTYARYSPQVRLCCDSARPVENKQCVCAFVTFCPIHGEKHVGSHD